VTHGIEAGIPNCRDLSWLIVLESRRYMLRGSVEEYGSGGPAVLAFRRRPRN
jgi:hypothetical protein